MVFDKTKDLMNEPTQLHISQNSNSFAYREANKTLATNLTYISDASVEKTKVIMVTSSIPHEGKTNLCVNLCGSLAAKGKKVILLDCDLRRGTLSTCLHLPRQDAGLSALLGNDFTLQDVNSLIKTWSTLQIDVMPSGYTTVAGGELLGSDRMRQLLRILRENYDFVICDTAPVQSVSDSLELGKYVDGAVLVVAQGVATKGVIQNTKSQLDNINIPILGTVLNMYDAKVAGAKAQDSYSYYSDYGYGYGEEQQQQ